MLVSYIAGEDGTDRKAIRMTQKAQQDYNNEFPTTYGRNDTQSWWIWGALAALAIGALVVWLANTTSQPGNTPTVGATTSEPAAPPPAVEAPAQPAPVAPAPIAPVN